MRSGRRDYGSLPNMDRQHTRVIKIGATGNCTDGKEIKLEVK